MFFTNNTILRTTFFCTNVTSNGILLTIALVSDHAGGEGGIQCSSLSLVLRGFAAPSLALRLNSSSAAPRAPCLLSSGDANGLLLMSESWECAKANKFILPPSSSSPSLPAPSRVQNENHHRPISFCQNRTSCNALALLSFFRLICVCLFLLPLIVLRTNNLFSRSYLCDFLHNSLSFFPVFLSYFSCACSASFSILCL